MNGTIMGSQWVAAIDLPANAEILVEIIAGCLALTLAILVYLLLRKRKK